MKPIFPLILPHIAHAGSIIESFKSSFSVTNKADESPVTEADIQASAYLVKSIHELSDHANMSSLFRATFKSCQLKNLA